MKKQDRKIYNVDPSIVKPIFVATTFGRPAKELADYLTNRAWVLFGKEKIYTEEYARKLMQRVKDMLGIDRM